MNFDKVFNEEAWATHLGEHFTKENLYVSSEPIIKEKFNFLVSIKSFGTLFKNDVDKLVPVYIVSIKDTKDTTRIKITRMLYDIIKNDVYLGSALFFILYENKNIYRFSYVKVSREVGHDGIISVKSDPKRYTYLLGEGIPARTPEQQLTTSAFRSISSIEQAFSVEPVTKAFYSELSDWYAWAVKIVKFPNKIDNNVADEKSNIEGIIRLITRLIFVWFLKQKKLIPNEFFDVKYIAENLIDGFNPNQIVDLFSKSEDSKYYKTVLQNLFFAMLNSPITPEGSDTISERGFTKGRSSYDNNKLMRYKDMFLNPDLFIQLANNKVPFLNGGLFDCLDDKDNGNYIDGFSNRSVVKKALIVPDYLFFGEEVGKNIDLSEFYGDKNKKKVSARGIIDILNRYNFTIEENTPSDQEIALDPELLGKVFENLLASYNPETKTTARKQTGSFYTPREIVQYMVDESLLAHLKRTVGDDLEGEYRKLMKYTDEEINLTPEQKKEIMQSLYDCKILDPACGSGAFPMGILQQMVHILFRLDPENELWKDMLMQNAIDETSDAYHNASNEERAEIVRDIEESFNEDVNRPDYARKLYLIERSIFGVDIQSIAVQISKLRFFISLVVDQKTNDNPVQNFGIRPLPNLEAKFIAANTLIGLNKKATTLFDSQEIKDREKELMLAKHKIFGAKTSRTKRKYKERVAELRIEIAKLLKDSDVVGNDEARQLQEWDMFDQNASSPFFDPEWMFGIKDGFDIVIGNPPYVSVKSISIYEKDIFSKIFFSGKGRFNLFTLFLEKGYNILTEFGVLVYIIPEGIYSNVEYRHSREFILKNTTLNKVCLFSSRVFEAAVDTTILSFLKQIPSKSLFSIERDIEEKIFSIKQDRCLKYPLYIIPTKFNTSISSIIDKILFNESYNKIGDCLEIQQGIIYSGQAKEDVFSNEAIDENYKKCLDGRDVLKWEVNWSNKEYNKYIHYTSKLHRPRDKRLFVADKKILIPRKATYIYGTIDDNQYYVLNTAYICLMINDRYVIEFLLALLNSKLINFIYRSIFFGWQITIPALNMLPIPNVSKEIQNQLVNIVNKILLGKQQNLHTEISVLEAEIDHMVYALYNLTEDEIKIVEEGL